MVSLMNRLGPFAQHTILPLDGNSRASQNLDRSVSVSFLRSPPRRRSLTNALALKRLIVSVDPDLVLTYNWGAMDAAIAATLGGAYPVIHNECGFGIDEAVRLKPHRVLARRWILRRAYRTIVVSRHLERLALTVFKLPANKVQFIQTGVDLDRFRPARNPEWRRLHGIGDEVLLFGFLGGLRPEKNLGLMIRAFAEVHLPSAKLVMFGAGKELEFLERLAREAGIADQVLFAGPTSQPAAAYAALEVFLLSSVTEQTPNALLEAMASGLPVVTTDVGDCTACLGSEQAAFVVPSNDLFAYAQAIRRLATDASLRQRLGRLNRERAKKNYSLEEMVRKYRELYRQAAAR